MMRLINRHFKDGLLGDGSYILPLHAIFVAADYLVPSVLPILLMLLAIDIFCALLYMEGLSSEATENARQT